MKHAILGAGAVGGLVGTSLAWLGETVIVVVRVDKVERYPETLTLDRPTGSLIAPAKAVARLAEPVDVLWIATKTYHLATALEAVDSAPKMVVPLLNGVDHIAALRERFGKDRVFPATIAVEAERLSPGNFVQRSPFVRLNLASSAEASLGPIISRLGEIGFTCEFTANEQTLLWSKLCFLGPMALVTSASGRNKGEVFDDPQWKHKLYRAVEEACAVASAYGAQVDASKIQAFIEPLPAAIRSSMQKDLEAKRQIELDAIAGPIVRGGQYFGIDVSVTKQLMDAVAALSKQN